VKKLDQFVQELRPFLQKDVEYDQAAVQKHLGKPEVGASLTAFADTLTTINPFNSAELESSLRSFAESRGVKAATLIHAARVAVTGRAVSPGLFDVLELLGRERVTERVRHAINFLPK
jgi:glutamyl/glutaminyl-tRNA synthetase